MEQDEIAAAGEHLPAPGYHHVYLKRRGDDFIDERDPDPTKTVSLIQTLRTAHAKDNEVAKASPDLAWQVERSRYETAHIQHMLNMPPGGLRFVMSDLPAKQLRALGRDVLGYDSLRKLGFMQILHLDEKRDLHIYGHTFDGDDMDAKRAVFAMFGRRLDESQWAIAQPIDEEDTQDIEPKELLERAVMQYDKVLYAKTGIEWFAGRDKASVGREANSFVREQTDLIEVHIRQLKAINPKSPAADRLRYDFVKAVRDRYLGISHATSDGRSISADV